jgi:DNA-binding YbaB/EbfC family protein
MNQMQQMLMEAQRLQRELVKAHEELDAKEFVVKKAGIVELVIKGDKTVKSLQIDKEALTADNEEMIEETIVMAINEALQEIKTEGDAIDERIAGRKGALPF